MTDIVKNENNGFQNVFVTELRSPKTITKPIGEGGVKKIMSQFYEIGGKEIGADWKLMSVLFGHVLWPVLPTKLIWD